MSLTTPLRGASDNCFVVNQLSTHNKFVLKPSLANHKFLYVGSQGSFRLASQVFFGRIKDYFVDDIIQIKEFQCLLKTASTSSTIERGLSCLQIPFISRLIDGLSQHYYNNTPWLDLTSDMEVAKFFAVTTFNMKLDCYEKIYG